MHSKTESPTLYLLESSRIFGDVFIAKIRNSEEYMALRITAVRTGIPLTNPDVQNYFDFSVKKAPVIVERKDIKLYDHHSTISDVDFLGGDKSGYDLVKGEHVAIFDDGRDIMPISAERREAIDMSELFFFDQDLGEFTMGGFTSGLNENNIGGNNTTTYSKANSDFDYDGIESIDDIKNAYNSGNESPSAANVSVDDVYIAKLRGIDQYAVICITNVMLETTAADAYFIEFNYKYAGTAESNNSGGDNGGGDGGNGSGGLITSTEELSDSKEVLNIYPNPVQTILKLEGTGFESTQIIISQLDGKRISTESVINNQIDLSDYPSGIYLLSIHTSNQVIITRKVIKQ